MFAVVNVTENWGIGRNDRLLLSIRADLRRFRELTEGKTVILGRKTLETFPHARPLKNRRNLILSRMPSFSVDGAEVFGTLDDLFSAVDRLQEVAVIGGASVYAALLDRCERVYLTKTFVTLPADRFFPDLDALPNWEVEHVSAVMEENGIRFQFVDYVNRYKP